MTKRLWIYPAVFCLLLSSALVEGIKVLGLILCLIWFIRIVLLKHRFILVLSSIIGILFVVSLFLQEPYQQTLLQGPETALVVYPDIISIKVDGDTIRFEGTVVTSENKFQKKKIVIRYYAQSEEEKNIWLHEPPNYFLKLEGELGEPSVQSNFHQFDYQKYLKRRGIHWQFNAAAISFASSNDYSKPVYSYFNTIRAKLLNTTNRTFSSKVAGYMNSLFFADRRQLSEEILANYRMIGVIHFFSISGFHISFLIKGLKYIFLRLGLTHERANLLLILLVPLYGMLAGFGISIFRAVFQAIFQMLAKLRHTVLDSIDAWSLTMLLALFINPFQLYDIAFQLSYMLSGLLIIMSKRPWIQNLSIYYSSLLFSFLAGLASIPILSYHFFEISWITVCANLVFFPFFSYLLFPSLIVLFVSAPLLKGTRIFLFLNQAVSVSIEGLEQILNDLNQIFNFSWVTGRLPQVVMLLLVLCIFYIIRRIEMKKRPSFMTVSCVILCLSYYQISPIGYVMMLDVGQGDSILIKDPVTRKVSLIDTGGQADWQKKEAWQLRENPFSIGQDIIVPALKAVGVSTIDYLYISHADVDHSGEIASINKEIKIQEVIATEKTFKNEGVQYQLAQLEPAKLSLAVPPEIISSPFEQTVIVHPKKESSSSNNHSLVMYGKIGDDHWLFTGDIEAEVERELITSYPNLTTDYLKVAHHGSNSSSTAAFIQHVQPHTALISAGKNNQFGHPHSEVLGQLEKENVRVYQTNEAGAIRVSYLRIPFVNSWYKKIDTVHTN